MFGDTFSLNGRVFTPALIFLFVPSLNPEEPTDLFLASVFIEASPPSSAQSVSFHRHQCCLFFSYFPSRHFR